MVFTHIHYNTYLPAETTNAYSKASESAISKNNSFWSVSVRDDIHSVYSEGDLSTMVQYAPNGGAVTVTIQNADGILWSCQGLDGEAVEAESSQSEGYTTFVIKNITQPVEVVATKTNPTFTVQYYANIDRYLLGNNGNLEVIDTSGKHLPTNSGSQSLLKLTLESIGQTTDQNKGNATSLNRVKSEKRLTQMYTDGTYNFEQHPGLKYFIFNGTHDAGAAANTFAFGNANCETGLGLAQWGGNNINAYADTYYLREVEAPAGYNKLADDVEVKIVPTASEDGKTLSLTPVTAKVNNNAGTELPSTGGMGTTIFYVLGSILVVAAVVLLVTKKRMSASDK